jgi:XRE family transcriptional regulator of biofilm formation
VATLDSLVLVGLILTAKGLAKMVKRLREQQGLSQTVLAKRAKVTQGYVAQIESGVSKNPSLAVLQRLAKALGVPVAELLG